MTTINKLKTGQTILFHGSKNILIGIITSVDINNNTVLCHDMVVAKNLNVQKGRWGGLHINVDKIIQIIQND
jgi:hypothetical protein